MKLEELTKYRIIDVKTQEEYDAVCEIMDRKYTPKWISGFNIPMLLGRNCGVSILSKSERTYSDGYYGGKHNETIIPASDFITANTAQ